MWGIWQPACTLPLLICRTSWCCFWTKDPGTYNITADELLRILSYLQPKKNSVCTDSNRFRKVKVYVHLCSCITKPVHLHCILLLDFPSLQTTVLTSGTGQSTCHGVEGQFYFPLSHQSHKGSCTFLQLYIFITVLKQRQFKYGLVSLI